MKNILLGFAVAFISQLFTNCLAQSNKLINPIITGFYPDPSIVKVGSDYYLVHSTFSYFPGLPVLHSKDLKNWVHIGNVIDRPSQMDFMGERLTRGLFAPGISYYKGLFYLTCTDIDHDGNFVVTAKNAAGPWSDPVKIPQVKGIDPSIYFDEDEDKAYILYNSDAPDRKPLYAGHRTIRMYEFDYKNLKVVGEEKQLVNGGVDLTKKPVWIEAPHILKRFGWYYLYAAEGGTSVNHSEVVLRSKNIWGPYIPYEKNPILTQRDLPADRKNPITSAGHGQFVDGPDGKMYITFLAVRPYEGDFYNTGRETFIAPVTWVDEWPVVDPQHKEIQYSYPMPWKEIKPAKGLPHAGNFSYTIKFNKQLEPTLLFMRTVEKNEFSLTKKFGLTLPLKPETVMEYGHPAFVGLRQQHLHSMAETELEFTPLEDHEKAGLIILQSENNFYFLCKSKSGEGMTVQLYKGTKSQNEMELMSSVPLSTTGSLRLKIESFGDKYRFSYQAKGREMMVLKDQVDGKFLSTKVAGGFLGSVYGMYATASGHNSSQKASFKYLTYTGKDAIFDSFK